MAEALSQSQIDDLLNRMRSGSVEEEVKEEKNKEYDFGSPKKFTKDQLKSLNNLYEKFSHTVTSYLTSVLRTLCEVSISQIEEQRYHEFSNSLPDNTLVAMIGFEPESSTYDHTTLMMGFSTTFGFLLVDRLMGGTGKVYSPERDYTDIEMSLLRLILEKITKHLEDAWANFFAVKTQLESIETNGRLLQAFSQQDVVVIVTLDIKDEHYKGTVNICMLAENLEEVINTFSSRYAHSSKQQNPERERAKKDLLMDYLKKSDLEIEAVLDKCQMSLHDISLLQVNDIIALNKKIDTDINVNVEGNLWYTARIGELETKKALKLVNAITK